MHRRERTTRRQPVSSLPAGSGGTPAEDGGEFAIGNAQAMQLLRIVGADCAQDRTRQVFGALESAAHFCGDRSHDALSSANSIRLEILNAIRILHSVENGFSRFLPHRGEGDGPGESVGEDEAAVPVSETNPCGVSRSSAGTRAPEEELGVVLCCAGVAGAGDGVTPKVFCVGVCAGVDGSGLRSCAQPHTEPRANAARTMAKMCLLTFSATHRKAIGPSRGPSRIDR